MSARRSCGLFIDGTRLFVCFLELGCEFWLGRIDDPKTANDHLLKFKVYLGVNPTDPKDIYVYAYLSKLTLLAVLDAFKLEHSLSKGNPIAETGFPGPFTFSYSLEGKIFMTLVGILQ